MIAALIEILAAGLRLWSDKERNKYLDRLMELQKAYYAEFNKPLEKRSDAELDRIEFELRVLGRAFASSVGKQDAPASAGGSHA